MNLETKHKPQDLDALAFHQGAHDIPLEETLKEVAAAHDMERSKLEHDSIRREKPLEARLDQLEHKAPGVDAAWAAVGRRLGLFRPPLALPLIVSLLGLIALIVDALLMGPGLDMLGIGDPILQFGAAFGFAALSSAIFHLAFASFGQNRHSVEVVIVERALAVFAVLALLAWGVMRANQVKFAADLVHNPLGNFLGNHPMLAAIFFCFVTLAAPVIGAGTLFDAAPRVGDWLNWKRAKREHDGLHAQLADTRKKLEEERAALDWSKSRLEAQRRVWEAAAAQYHERGRRNGARQEPGWLVPMKATGWSLGGLALGGVLGSFFPPLYLLLPAGTWLAAYLHYRHARLHPGYDEFKRLENTRFAVTADQPAASTAANPKLLPPSEEEL